MICRSRRPLLRRWMVTAALVVATPAAGTAQPFSTLTFFGDSFTDTGNVSTLASWFFLNIPGPPYASGRYSNGPLWSEYLAGRLGRPGDATAVLRGGRNFAFAGARAAGPGSVPLIETDITTQVVWSQSRTNSVADPTGLYVLFAGGNDLVDAADLGDAAARVAVAQNAALEVGFMAYWLGLSGARTFLIPSLPDVGRVPEAFGNPARSAVLTELTAIYNGTLDAILDVVRPALPGASILGLRLDNLFANVLADVDAGGGRYGFTNATVPCFGAGATTPCARSVFVDGLHPTTAAHRLIADAAYERVVLGRDVELDAPFLATASFGARAGVAAVTSAPEPATVVLVAGGLVAVGAVVRRRKGVRTAV